MRLRLYVHKSAERVRHTRVARVLPDPRFASSSEASSGTTERSRSPKCPGVANMPGRSFICYDVRWADVPSAGDTGARSFMNLLSGVPPICVKLVARHRYIPIPRFAPAEWRRRAVRSPRSSTAHLFRSPIPRPSVPFPTQHDYAGAPAPTSTITRMFQRSVQCLCRAPAPIPACSKRHPPCPREARMPWAGRCESRGTHPPDRAHTHVPSRLGSRSESMFAWQDSSAARRKP